MPVFERYNIQRYKEILINQASGLVQDGGFSTYTLDDPSITPNGTGDFLGVIKTAVLLGEVYKEIIDTKNISFAQFNNLTQQEFDTYVSQGLILVNRQTNGAPQKLGWVEMGRTRASFYYQTCDSTSKQPVSENFYDIGEFKFENKILIGEGSEIEPTQALTPIGNFDLNITNNLGVLRPRFEPLNLTDYVRFALTGNITNTDGETARIGQLSLTDQTRPLQVSLLMANKNDHFDNQYATEITPGKWGMVRRTISESLKPGVHVIYPQLNVGTQQSNPIILDFGISQGVCLKTTNVSTPTGDGAVVVDGGTTITPETEERRFFDDEIPTTIVTRLSISNRFNPLRITGIPSDGKDESYGFPPPTGDNPIYNGSSQNRLLYQIRGTINGWKDPRELLNDNLNLPNGYLYGFFNEKTDVYEVTPAILRETIVPSIPQRIGATRSYLSNIYRRNVSNMYSLTGVNKNYLIEPLTTTMKNKKNIGPYEYSRQKYLFESDQLVYGIGADEVGRVKFSDSESFRERCIFTGYNETFMNGFSVTVAQMESGLDEEKKFWKKAADASKSKSLNGIPTPDISPTFIDKDGKEKNRVFTVTYRSKSGKYTMSTLPISTMFLGYRENYAIQSSNTDLENLIKSIDPTGNTKISNLTPEISATGRDGSPTKNGEKIYQPKYSTIASAGSFRNLLMYGVYKNDVILSDTMIDYDKIYLKTKIKSPKIARRAELYGPNPFKHILYSDFIGWSRYLTDYNISDLRKKLIPFVGKNTECYNTFLKYGGRAIKLSQRYEDPIFFTEPIYNTYWIEIKDKTRIMDVYFGLMEMHIKGYPWELIFEVMDKLPTDTLSEFVNGMCVNPQKVMDGYEKVFDSIISEPYESLWNFMIEKKYVSEKFDANSIDDLIDSVIE